MHSGGVSAPAGPVHSKSMTDYYPLIARAIAGLEKNTGEARRALYERARNALVAQLRSLTPPLTESEITRERLALEEAVRKIEAESARRARVEVPRAAAGGAAAAAAPAVVVRPAEAPQVEEPPASEPPEPEPEPDSAPARLPVAAAMPPVADEAPKVEEPPPPTPPSPPEPVRAPTRLRVRERERASQPEEGIKGLRDVVAEAETLGEATAQAARSAREAYSAVPASAPELDRLEPRMEPAGLRTPPRERIREKEKAREKGAPPRDRAATPVREKTVVAEAAARPADELVPPPEPSARGSEQPSRAPEPRPAAARLVAQQPAAPTEAAAGLALSRKGLIAAVVAVLVIVALGVGLYTQRDMVSGLFNGGRNAVQAQRDAGAARPKISDRVGQAAQPNAAPAGSPADAAVAQRVVLYEEDPTDPQGKRFVGSAIWRTETVSPGPGLSPELAVRADLEIPERRITMTMSMRRNTDQALPASHTIEILFNLPTDFPFGGVSNVPGILMKQAEQTRGAPLAGLAVKVTSGFFLVGLSAVDADRQRNIQLLKERSWFDVPIVFNNGRRAILAVEKGNPGERAFNDAFGTWGE
jgi:hypothetical protein